MDNNFEASQKSLSKSETFQDPGLFTDNAFVINVFNATIQEITSDRSTRFVTISYDECVRCNNREQVVKLVADRDTLILNQWGNVIPVSDLRVGMTVNASFSTAMTRSIPPQSRAFIIQTVTRPSMYDTTVGRIVNTDSTNQFITVLSNNNPASVIRFNVAPNAVILTPFGRTTGFSSLFPGMRVRITHASFMTLSIPPQTTAYRIQMLR